MAADVVHLGFMAGGSGKRQLADGACVYPKTIGKLRRLRLPLPPIAVHLDRGG